MGLGKTIEVIALILLHTPVHRNMLPLIWNTDLQIWIKPVKVCAEIILLQNNVTPKQIRRHH
ncbi:hypothetical protein BS47DRAFT_1335632 [Hydnum rufescens UP504]|uniref:Uncharacterized protein n=1 Tax=Hydnum rufescens UP504 TaxID=1448309 RepID=A0A9P6E2L5_9AGAM|nr:hypothetical protein BS47DRAFT_1335632 [Hydnum rufescens UP504]